LGGGGHRRSSGHVGGWGGVTGGAQATSALMLGSSLLHSVMLNSIQQPPLMLNSRQHPPLEPGFEPTATADARVRAGASGYNAGGVGREEGGTALCGTDACSPSGH
jgi:hypothetical protein